MDVVEVGMGDSMRNVKQYGIVIGQCFTQLRRGRIELGTRQGSAVGSFDVGASTERVARALLSARRISAVLESEERVKDLVESFV